MGTTWALEEVYKAVRSVVAPWDKDRYMSPDIKEATQLLKDEKIWQAARLHMESYHNSQTVETRVFSPSTFTIGGELPPPRLPRKRKVSVETSQAKKSCSSKCAVNCAVLCLLYCTVY